MKGVLIAGTGTDVGKTGLSLALGFHFMQLGLRVGYLKPVQCGTYPQMSGTVGGDGDFLRQYWGPEIEIRESHFFKDPVSPHLASHRESKPVSGSKIVEDFHQLTQVNDVVLVEMAGGVAVPLNSAGKTLLDIAEFKSLPVIVAASPILGTLNHTILTYEFLKTRGYSRAALVMVHLQKEVPEIYLNNIETLRALTNLRFLGEVGYIGSLSENKPLREEEIHSLGSGFMPDLTQWLGLSA